MYVNFEYYSSVLKGSVLSEGTFQKAEQEAEAYIRYLTYLNGDIFADTAPPSPPSVNSCKSKNLFLIIYPHFPVIIPYFVPRQA